MKRNLTAIVSGDTAGSNYYRAHLVKRGLDALEPEESGIEAIYTDRWHPTLDAAVQVLYLVHPNARTIDIDKLHSLKRRGVAIVADLDDQIFDVPEYSQAHLPSQQRAYRDFRLAVLACADVVTTTTEHFRDVLAAYTDGERYAIPNAFDTSIRYARPAFTDRSATPAIGWFGGIQHHGDLVAVDAVFRELLRRDYGLVFMGSAPAAFKGRSFRTHGERLAFLDGAPNVEQYFGVAPLIGIDVGLAPLAPNHFNDCKSPIKPLEYRYLCGVPCVASDVRAYDELPADGEYLHKLEGFDVDEWIDAIEQAIEVSARGRSYELPDRYTLAATAPRWAEVFRRAAQIAQEDA